MGQLPVSVKQSYRGLLFAFLLFLPAWAQDSTQVPFESRIGLECRLEPPEVAVGDTTIYYIQVSWKGPTEDFIFFAPNVPECRGVAFSHMQTISEKKGTIDGVESKTIYRLYFVGESAGSGRIGDVAVKYLSRGAKEPEILSASGRPVTVHPPRKQFPWGLAIKSGLVILLGSVLGAGAMRIRKNRKSRAAELPEKTPLDTALEGLAAARRRILEGDASAYYNETCLVLKTFLHESDIAGARGLSTSKLLQAIEGAALEDADKKETKALLSACEEMRFSGFSPEPHEIEIFESRVKNLLRNLSERRTVHGR